MRVVVLGAGIVGVTTAYRLLKDGHQVTVIDRATGPGQITSFANAGLVAPGHAYAWASPAAPKMMWRSLWQGDQAIRFKPRASLAQWRWVLAFLRQCTKQRTQANTAVKANLCRYARAELQKTVAETGIAYDANAGGLIYFYRTAAAFAAAARKSQMLRAQGIAIETRSQAEVVALDPGLATCADVIQGALYAPDDESGDAYLFSKALAEYCTARGVSFQYDTVIRRLRAQNGSMTGVETDKGLVTADAYVLCLGVDSPALASPLGIKLPIYPVRGYSVTLPITDFETAPRLGGVDEENLLAYCPMGDRLRLTATAEISGYSTASTPANFAPMLARAQKLFGHCADFSRAEYWVGLRPMTPTGVPIVVRAPLANLWLNTGHGHMGWTMSNGCAQIVADMIAGRAPEIDIKGLRYEQN